mgnify:CR=1 FL=1|tara:strand:- start:17774 stop:18010 length:237 start_codon:yes stop_codon:yes gene_type:complete
MKLSSNQLELLQFIEDFRNTYENSPKQVEIAEKLNISKTSVNLRLKTLRNLKLVGYSSVNRSLMITDLGYKVMELNIK